MPRPRRVDFAGAWLHVMIRALSKRPLFEGTRDVRDFLAGLALAVRRYEIEIHAYAFLTTHVHLLVRSPKGDVSHAFQCALSAYVLRFNRRRDRDGPLLRGRFHSKVIRTDEYWMAVVRYIDQNPVKAGLAQASRPFLHSSRMHYARRSGPAWLTRDRIEAEVCVHSGVRPYDPACYAEVFGTPLAPEIRDLVESSVLRRERPDDPFGDLLGAASPSARERFEQNRLLADGQRGWPMLAPASLVREVVSTMRVEGPWVLKAERISFDGWDVLECGLLRGLAGESQEALAVVLGLPRSTLRDQLRRHRSLYDSDSSYALRFSDAVEAVRTRLRELCR